MWATPGAMGHGPGWGSRVLTGEAQLPEAACTFPRLLFYTVCLSDPMCQADSCRAHTAHASPSQGRQPRTIATCWAGHLVPRGHRFRLPTETCTPHPSVLTILITSCYVHVHAYKWAPSPLLLSRHHHHHHHCNQGVVYRRRMAMMMWT